MRTLNETVSYPAAVPVRFAAFTCFFHFVSSHNFKQEHSGRAASLSRTHLSQWALVEAAVPTYRVAPAVLLSRAGRDGQRYDNWDIQIVSGYLAASQLADYHEDMGLFQPT
jgi:hypothetical protein